MTAPTEPVIAPKLVNVKVAAEALGISVPFLRTLIRRKAISSVRMGRRLLVRVRDIDAVIDAGGVGKEN